MFPYRDETRQRTPFVTFTIIAVNARMGVVEAQITLGVAEAVSTWLIPGIDAFSSTRNGMEMGRGLVCLTDPGRQAFNLLTSMFLHGSWMHLLGNMWFFWLFGNNIEDSMGRGRFVVFYLLCGLFAAFAQVIPNPTSIVPMVGASGAISGIMGAYLVLYPRVRVFTLVPLGFFLTTIALPARLMLVYLDGDSVLRRTAVHRRSRRSAFWAHIGGFVAGMALIKLFSRRDYLEEHGSRHWHPQRVGWRGSRWDA
jgi:membrane associated rhomboid family serine protease